jgi:hypothetical protein
LRSILISSSHQCLGYVLLLLVVVVVVVAVVVVTAAAVVFNPYNECHAQEISLRNNVVPGLSFLGVRNVKEGNFYGLTKI